MIESTEHTVCPVLIKFQCETEVWRHSSFSCSLHQTLHSGPQWSGSSSLLLSLQNHRITQVFSGNPDSQFLPVQHSIAFTFSHEGRNFEIHEWDRRVVCHIVLFHVIKLHPKQDCSLLFSWWRQSQKGAEFVHFPFNILKTHGQLSTLQCKQLEKPERG